MRERSQLQARLASPRPRAVVVTVALLALAARAPAAAPVDSVFERISLYSVAVAEDVDGDVVTVDERTPLVDGTRAVPGAGADVVAAEQRAWLAQGTVPGSGGPYADMVRDALLDLHVLSQNGAAAAGWTDRWRYVWPRDAAFVAAAFAAAGHPDDALEVMQFLQSVQAGDGRFQARYRLDGSGPPDGRGVQLDGTGWSLWGAAQVAQRLSGTTRVQFVRQLAPLIDRSTSALLRMTDDGRRLPPASADFWEVPESSVTLGTAAVVLAGLQAATMLQAERGEVRAASQARSAAAALQSLIETRFGSRGYPRYADGDQVDAAVTFLLPPFVQSPLRGAARAWAAAPRRMARPAGGVAPGQDWKQDGVSWTPETALFAVTAARTGKRVEAARWLDWLDVHRTSQGSLPEKVLYDGSPAAVAPLAWTAASVVLAVDALTPPAEPRGQTRPVTRSTLTASTTRAGFSRGVR